MRVLFIGAIRRNGFATVRALRKKGIDCEIFLPENMIPNVLYEHERLQMPGWIKTYKSQNKLLKVRDYILSRSYFRKFDVIHSRCLGIFGKYKKYFFSGIPYVEQTVGSEMREMTSGHGVQAKRVKDYYRSCEKLIISQTDHMKICGDLKLNNYSYIPLLADTENYFPDEDKLPFHEYELTILHPTNHDWTYSHGDRSPEKGNDKAFRNSSKGNDRLIRAFARIVNGGSKALLILLNRGIDVAESKQLIDDLGISNNVIWLEAMDNKTMRKYFNSVDLVADQFSCGSLGLIAFDAMACGTPVLGYLDKEPARKCYEVLPPLLNCKTEDDIFLGLSRLSLSDLPAMGELSRKWVLANHDPGVITDKLIYIYNQLFH